MPNATIVLQGLDKKTLLRVQRVIAQPERVLKQVGAVVLADAQRAFKDQRLGEIRWAARYPKQAPPFINIAGVVGDFLAGRKSPPARRFDNRPANIDTGLTLRSLTPSKAISVSGYVVTVKANTPQAGKLQNGGVSRQQITQQVKDLLGKWMKRERRSFNSVVKKAGGTPGYVLQRSTKKGGKGSLWQRIFGSGKTVTTKFKSVSVKKAAERFGAVQKLGFLFRTKVLVTKNGARPFLGITDEGKKKILLVITGQFLPPGLRSAKP